MKKFGLLLIGCFFMTSLFAQFEQEKLDADNWEKVKVHVGADFAIQLQGLNHELSSTSTDTLLDLKSNINLPTANLSITADLAPGVQVFLNNYLSSRHHNEAWVEGGYLLMDRLPFLPQADNIMEYITLKAGVMMPNYGDAHFFRSNNAAVTNNPFVGNWIMDAFTTNPGLEIMFRKDGIIAMVGTNNGRVNFGRGNDFVEDMVFNWKLGYDKSITEDIRLRFTTSGYHVPEGHSGSYLWGGDRAGARYYNVMQMYDADDNFRSGRWDPGSGQSQMNSFMFNLYTELYGLKLFGLYEIMAAEKRGAEQNFSQIGVQALYSIKDLYFGGRFNTVSDNDASSVNRINFGAGYFMTQNILVKLDYVNQTYSGPAHGAIDGGSFKGVVFEAAISF